MRSVSRLAAAALVGGALFSAPLASADIAQGFANSDGSVKCDFTTLDGTYISCLSEGARATRPECNPPGQKAPQYSYYAGRTYAGCYNQGLMSTSFDHIQPGQVRQYNELTVIADMKGGLHFVSPQGYKGYAGKTAVSGPEGLGQVSSRAL